MPRLGSSPLARGTHLTRGRAATRLRLIPARAGNTLRQPCTTCAYPAHPRSRGEHTNLFLPLSFLLGSSPLARGTRNQRVGLAVPARLIPARAGNTPQSAAQYQASVAHPRSRGEHTAPMNVWDGFRGSSPLARGTHFDEIIAVASVRLIPARAGNTKMLPIAPQPPAAHPRSRGEHFNLRGDEHVVSGSSPLARGTLEEMKSKLALGRLIPARAGNTGRRGCRY